MEIITTELEHPSVIGAVRALEREGVVVKYTPVTAEGLIILSALEQLVTKKTVLFTTAYANSEIGVVQPVGKIARLLRARTSVLQSNLIIHIDGAQAPLWLPCQLDRLGVDILTLDGAKCGGPKGVGVVAMKKYQQLSPITYGGGQEGGIRPGTENVAGIVGIGVAISLAQKHYETRARSVMKIRDQAIAYMKNTFPEAVLNGPLGNDRLANNINFSLPGIDTEYAVVYLDRYGVAASTKSACAGAGGGESAVVKVISGDAQRARSTIRLTMSETTSFSELERTLRLLQKHCQLMKLA
jgi:cysteine desulfurase